MVDRGFTIERDIPCGVKLVISSLKVANWQQLTANKLSNSKVIPWARVHLERCMRMLKSFILRQELKLSYNLRQVYQCFIRMFLFQIIYILEDIPTYSTAIIIYLLWPREEVLWGAWTFAKNKIVRD